MTGGVSTHDEGTWTDAATQTSGRDRHRRRGLTVVVLSLLVVLVGVGAWLGLRAFQAATALQAVADGVMQVRTQVAAGDMRALAAPVDRVRSDARRAAEATADPVWRLAEVLPVVGADAVAVRTVAGALDGLATDVLTPLVEVAGTVDPALLRPVDGRFDLAPLISAAPRLATAAQASAAADEALADLDPAALHGPLPDAVTELQTQVGEAAVKLGAAARVAGVLPAMLGADGPRAYLVLFLNSAELRTSGGIPGAIAVVTANDGVIELSRQESASNLSWLDEPALPLSPEELLLASDRLGRMIQNTALVPDAPRSGELAAAIWREHTGQQVDGVLTADTVALSYTLRALGDVPHPDGSVLSADSFVQALLFDAYARYPDPDDSDRYFAGVASTVFQRISDGVAEPQVLLEGLDQAVDERRISVWSARAEEQDVIRGSRVDGALLSGGHDSAVGVFLDNGSGWKTDTFLSTDLVLDAARCESGTVTLDLRLELASSMPEDVDSLPYYVVGDGSSSTGVPPGVIRQRISVYSPVDGTVHSVQRGDQTIGGVGARLAGRDVRVVTATLGPGESSTFRMSISAPAHDGGIPLWSTPTSRRAGLTTLAAPCG